MELQYKQYKKRSRTAITTISIYQFWAVYPDSNHAGYHYELLDAFDEFTFETHQTEYAVARKNAREKAEANGGVFKEVKTHINTNVLHG